MVDRAYTKSRLLKELAFRVGIKQSLSEAILATLADIIYREAPIGGFILPGVCRIEVAEKKLKKTKNPVTGEVMVLAPHIGIKVTMSDTATMAIAPKPRIISEKEYLKLSPDDIAALVPARVVPPPYQVPDAVKAEADSASGASAESKPAAAPTPAKPTPAPAPTPSKPAPSAPTPPASRPTAPTKPNAGGSQFHSSLPSAPKPTPPAPPKPTPPAPTKPTPPAASSSPLADIPRPTPHKPATPPPAPTPAPAPEIIIGDAQSITFKCPTCGQEVEAPIEAVGMEAECPMCGSIVTVPAQSDVGLTASEVVTADAAAEMEPSALKNRTIRINFSEIDLDAAVPEEPKIITFFCSSCQQEIEAPSDMIGQTAECPNCGNPVTVPPESQSEPMSPDSAPKNGMDSANKGRTMRINLSDF